MARDADCSPGRRLIGGVLAAVAMIGSMVLVDPGIANGSPGEAPTLTSVEPLNSPTFGGGGTVTFHGSGFSTAAGGTRFLIGPLDPCNDPCVEFQNVVCSSDSLCFGTAPAFPEQPTGSCEAITFIGVVVDGQQGVLDEDFSWGTCPAADPDPDDLADTGASPTLIGIAAASALLAGAGLLQLARRRRA